jgi:hypothetical protein
VERLASRLGLTGDIVQRPDKDGPYLTDGGHFILDASFGRIPDAEALANGLVCHSRCRRARLVSQNGGCRDHRLARRRAHPARDRTLKQE